MARTQALAADAAQRAAQGSPEEAALVAAAQRSLVASLQELASGNLFQARVAVAEADPVQARALGVASAGAPGR